MVNKRFTFAVAALLLALSCQHSFGAERVIPKPRLKPDKASEVEPEMILKFPALPLLGGWSKASVNAERLECQQRLKGLNIKFATMAPMGNDGGCGAPAPIMVSEIAGVAIAPPAELTCDMAEALHGWISSSALPAARQHLKKQLVQINNATAYACRRRNGLATGKLSEHAKANALDIATLAFSDGSQISIKGDWTGIKQLVGLSDKAAFLRQVRRDACIRFTTVLGPGSDQYHGDHFHIDVARRKNGYRICK